MTLPSTTRRALGAASILALSLAPLALTGTAHAETFTGAAVDGDARLVYTAVSGVKNQVVASVRWNTAEDELIYVIDDSIRIQAGGPCSHPDKDDLTRVRCVVTPPEGADPYPTLTMNLGDDQDSVRFTNTTKQTYFFNKFALGPGADRFVGTTDAIDGSLVLGQGGEDTIKAGPRAAAIGGIGNDRLTVVGKDSAASGGSGNDQIWGSAGPQHLIGSAGDDRIWGGSGNDTLLGEEGNDSLWGQPGDDKIFGANGDDRIWGGLGKDVLRGGPGKNVVKQ